VNQKTGHHQTLATFSPNFNQFCNFFHWHTPYLTIPRGVARNLIWVGINGSRRQNNHIKKLRQTDLGGYIYPPSLRPWPYLTFGVGRLLHLPSAEAVSVRPNAQPRCNQRSQSSAVKPKIGCEAEQITSHLGLVTCSMVGTLIIGKFAITQSLKISPWNPSSHDHPLKFPVRSLTIN